MESKFVVDVDAMVINVEFKELQILMGPTAVFHSKVQAAATELCTYYKSQPFQCINPLLTGHLVLAGTLFHTDWLVVL